MINKKPAKPKRKISFKFGSILAIVSIIGFLEIISDSFFNFNFGDYMSFLWLTIMGTGFVLISKPKKIARKKEDSVNDITTLVIGILAIIAGLLSLPFIGVIHPVFLATKGVISIISILFIILETWILPN